MNTPRCSHHRWGRRVVVSTSLLFAWLHVSVALSQTDTTASEEEMEVPTPISAPTQADLDRARELFDNGYSLYQEGDYPGSITAWAESYRLSGEPLLLYNIANALERANRIPEALTFLQRYRPFVEAAERETLLRRIENMEDRVAEIRAEERQRQEDQQRRQDDEGGLTGVQWAFIGVAVVGYTVGTIFGVMTLGGRSDLEENCRNTQTGIYCPEDMRTTVDDEGTNAAIADVGFGVGIAATVGLILTFALDNESANPSTPRQQTTPGPSTSTRPWITLDSVGVTWDLRF